MPYGTKTTDDLKKVMLSEDSNSDDGESDDDHIRYLTCEECGNEQPDMGANVACEECGALMPDA